MYIVLLIALIGFLLTWPMVRHYARIWVNRSLAVTEFLLSGIIAWLLLFSLVAWIIGIIITWVNYFSTHEAIDIWVITFAILITGAVLNFLMKSRYELGLDDTKEFFTEAIQFRRSEKRRLDIPSELREGRKKTSEHKKVDPVMLERKQLQANLSKEKEQDTLLALLREGIMTDMIEVWHFHEQSRSHDPIYEKVKEVKIDPKRKRFSIFADFPELHEEQLKDEITVLRHNRHVFDFLQSLNTAPWLKPFMPFFDHYFLLCRATKPSLESGELLYPFMKMGITVSELRKLEGSYFNPRKFSEIATLAFNNGAQV